MKEISLSQMSAVAGGLSPLIGLLSVSTVANDLILPVPQFGGPSRNPLPGPITRPPVEST